jgi:DNA-directed RNA polymerase subunit RPC12/RpoP
MLAIDQATGRCVRCGEEFGDGNRCHNCGVDRHRRVVKARRHAKLGGKRGRNSGKVSQHGKKG